VEPVEALGVYGSQMDTNTSCIIQRVRIPRIRDYCHEVRLFCDRYVKRSALINALLIESSSLTYPKNALFLSAIRYARIRTDWYLPDMETRREKG